MVDVPDLRQLGLVVSVLDGLPDGGRGRVGVTTLIRPSHALCYQHVVQPHELGVWRILEYNFQLDIGELKDPIFVNLPRRLSF